jgi:hypothetical protein
MTESSLPKRREFLGTIAAGAVALGLRARYRPRSRPNGHRQSSLSISAVNISAGGASLMLTERECAHPKTGPLVR